MDIRQAGFPLSFDVSQADYLQPHAPQLLAVQTIGRKDPGLVGHKRRHIAPFGEGYRPGVADKRLLLPCHFPEMRMPVDYGVESSLRHLLLIIYVPVGEEKPFALVDEQEI